MNTVHGTRRGPPLPLARPVAYFRPVVFRARKRHWPCTLRRARERCCARPGFLGRVLAGVACCASSARPRKDAVRDHSRSIFCDVRSDVRTRERLLESAATSSRAAAVRSGSNGMHPASSWPVRESRVCVSGQRITGRTYGRHVTSRACSRCSCSSLFTPPSALSLRERDYAPVAIDLNRGRRWRRGDLC